MRGLDLAAFSQLSRIFVGELEPDASLEFVEHLPASLSALRLADCLLIRLPLLAQLQRIASRADLHQLTDLSLDSQFCEIFRMPYLLPTIPHVAASYPYEILEHWLVSVVVNELCSGLTNRIQPNLCDAVRPLTNLRTLRIGVVFFACRTDMVSLLHTHYTHPGFDVLSCDTCLAQISFAMQAAEVRVITELRAVLPSLHVFECYSLYRATPVIPGVSSIELQQNSLVKKFILH